MRMEKSDIISRVHGNTASEIRNLAEKYWETTKDHYKKRDAESSRAQAGK
jgi:hypothetical protein